MSCIEPTITMMTKIFRSTSLKFLTAQQTQTSWFGGETEAIYITIVSAKPSNLKINLRSAPDI